MAETPKTRTSGKPHKKGAINLEDKVFRFLGMVLFGLLLYPVYLLFLVLVAVQYIIYFAEDAPNEDLDAFLNKVRSYIGEIFAFLGFAKETMPFPFSDFPEE